ncbi:MAG: hypothetical protein U0641_02750 [Anaerolineae bacterium]
MAGACGPTGGAGSVPCSASPSLARQLHPCPSACTLDHRWLPIGHPGDVGRRGAAAGENARGRSARRSPSSGCSSFAATTPSSPNLPGRAGVSSDPLMAGSVVLGVVMLAAAGTRAGLSRAAYVARPAVGAVVALLPTLARRRAQLSRPTGVLPLLGLAVAAAPITPPWIGWPLTPSPSGARAGGAASRFLFSGLAPLGRGDSRGEGRVRG